jgi:putative ABC transport system ATP-binding protein
MKEIMKTENLKKDYYLGKIVVPALRGVDISVREGEFIALMGPSGSGKTTMLNLVGLLDTPTAGKIFLDSMDASSLSQNERTNFRLSKIGFVFQFFNLFMELKAAENVMLPMMMLGKNNGRRKKAEKLLELVGLGERANHYPSELSGGEQQRVTIARALANEPAILLADEPTANLDSTTACEIMDLFRRLNREEGQTILLITHEEELGAKADRIIRLKDGKIF